jgi:hypothetical protein
VGTFLKVLLNRSVLLPSQDIQKFACFKDINELLSATAKKFRVQTRNKQLDEIA